ncbi:MAG: M20/M25/M40 family metallo-hydrolase [Bryobacteraceae bacterium]|nr:M20/M25/M40 family metallo-hydrolase [Bryobacteraceae bacterium]MDW8378940.1 M20/M25/M40 family metallo-hydrolase [Bryobacterales bacterium]
MDLYQSLRLGLVLLTTFSALLAEDKADLAIVHRIRQEAFQNSKLMEHLFYLTDVNGHRLTGSEGYKKAADWVRKRAQEYGLENAKLESWGPFGRTWDYTKFAAHLIEPAYSPLIGFPLAWTQGTNGTLLGEPVQAILRSFEDLDKHKGKLKGKIVLIDPVRETPLLFNPLSRRFTDGDLAGVEQAPDPGAISPVFGRPSQPGTPSPLGNFRSMEELRRFRTKRAEFLREEGVLMAISNGTAGDGGTVFATSGGSHDPKTPLPPPMIVLTPEHYNRIVRLLERKIPVKLEVEVQARISEGNQDSWNVTAEIPGTRKKDEVVMIGAHLDSWHGGTGATDNAAGSAVVLEVMRILKSLHVAMDRTVRMALWSGEEQGLLGSRAYVKSHFADPAKMIPTSEHAKLSAYYNLDNGTGKIRGVYLQGNDMVRPIFAAWLEPFRDLGATTLSIRSTGGTDHLSFDAVGLPAFQFIQDPIEYNTRTHHSNMDVYDHVSRGDLMQAAAVMASFVYHTAMRSELLPRKPLPKPQPERQSGATERPSGGQ